MMISKMINAYVVVENLLWNQRQAIKGQTVLDIGSHMGTFAFAALEMGAKYVHCIDAEEKLVAQGNKLFKLHGVDKSRYRFETAVAAEFMNQIKNQSYDTIFCFGVLYYFPDPFDFLRSMVRIARKNILIDTFTAAYSAVQGADSEFIRNNISEGTFDLPLMLTIPTQSRKSDYHLVDSFVKKSKSLSLTHYPTIRLLETWFEAIETGWQRIDWVPYAQGVKNWRDLVTQEQKKDSHWVDIYISDLRTSFWLYPKIQEVQNRSC